jgi:uncharacterized membrane protein YdjX (TVP38/TMEM64 family)
VIKATGWDCVMGEGNDGVRCPKSCELSSWFFLAASGPLFRYCSLVRNESLETRPAALRNSLLIRALAIGAMALVCGMIGWSYATGGIFHVLLHSGTADEKVAALRAFFDGFGVAAPLAYVGFVILEVVIAPIPGTMLYAPGGVIFGGFWGGLLSLTGNVIGAGMACQLMRVFIGERAEEYLERSALARYEERITRHGAWVIFLLRVNPLTSSDLVSYAAGLTHLSVWKLMLGTLVGMAPLCFAQSYLADGLLHAFPMLIYPLVAACAVYGLVVVWILIGLLKR